MSNGQLKGYQLTSGVTLIAPNLGTPSAVNLANATNLPINAITGSTLPSGINASSLTAVGTLISLHVSGNAGFGTNSPAYPVDISTSQSFGPHLRIASSGNESVIQLSTTSSGGRLWELVSGGAAGSLSGGLFGIYDATAATVRLAITPAGNVGLGTITPAETLDVNGSIHLENTTPNSTSLALYNNSGTLTWNGAAISSFVASGTGGISRLMQSKLNDQVWLDDYRQSGDADDTAAWQRAANQCAANISSGHGESVVRLRSRPHYVSATINHPPYTGVIHDGPRENCPVIRTGDYGNTIVCGADGGASAGPFICKGLWFQHGTMYVAGSYTLSTPIMTNGAHIWLHGSQGAIIEDCLFWRGRMAIIYSGGSLLAINRCRFVLCWDPLTTAAQEGVATIWCDAGGSFVNPKDLTVTNSTFLGADNSPYTRNRTITDANGHSQTVAMLPMIGPINHLLVSGCETITWTDNYAGNASDANIYLNPSSGGYIAMATFKGGLLDASGNVQFRLQCTSGATRVNRCLLDSVKFNGEYTTFQQLIVLAQGGIPSVDVFDVINCPMWASYGTGIIMAGADEFKIIGGAITDYNALGVTPSTGGIDAQFAAAIYVEGPDTANKYGLIDDVSIGGSGNDLTGSGNCWLGVFLDGTADNTKIGRINYLGVNGMTGSSRTMPITLGSGVTSFNVTAWVEAIFCANTSPLTLVMPTNHPPGWSLWIKDILNASTANITVNLNGNYLDSSNTNPVINLAKGSLEFMSNGGTNFWKK